MVERILDSTLGNINPSILYVCAAVLIVMLILGIVKKAMSVIVVAVILVAGCLYLVPQVVEYQENLSRDTWLKEKLMEGNESICDTL